MSASFLCIGGAVLDRKLIAAAPFRLGSSNPVVERLSHGGVARNVAETLARLGQRVRFASCVGEDAAGVALMDALAGLGVDVAGVRRVAGAATATYTALIGPDGDLLVGAADMAVLDGLYGDVVEEALAGVGSDGLVFADCNAPPATLARMIAQARRAGWRLALDAISTLKATRLPADLTGVGCLFLNRDEAAAMLADPGVTPDQAVAALLAKGAAQVVLTLGAQGALAGDAAGIVAIPAQSVAVVDVTGAGDALIAGTLAGLARGAPLVAAVAFGTSLAARTVQRTDSVDPSLSPALIAQGLPATPAWKERP